MDRLALAKCRASRRAQGAGAVMFIVAMTLVVLASVGVYALAAASVEMRTSGNERQNTQTHYLAAYGVLATAREMTTTKADNAMSRMQSTDSTVNTDVCPLSLPGITQRIDLVQRGGCLRTLASDTSDKLLTGSWGGKTATVAYGSSVPLSPSIAPGSLGPTPMIADFYIELTSAIPWAKAPGYSDEWCSYQITVTSQGITQPLYPGTDLTGQFGGEGLEIQRARIIALPIQCHH
jgi:Tfp pilus assembly protein PilX